jgi:hypothetical protein
MSTCVENKVWMHAVARLSGGVCERQQQLLAISASAECVWGKWEPWGEWECGDGLQKHHRSYLASCERMLMAESESRACSC